MRHITAEDRPPPDSPDLQHYRKTATTYLQHITSPVTIQTMEGTTYAIDETSKHWDSGYFISWPTDGSDPYPVAPSFVRDNYELITESQDQDQ